jgi:hypothetical protein
MSFTDDMLSYGRLNNKISFTDDILSYGRLNNTIFQARLALKLFVLLLYNPPNKPMHIKVAPGKA